MLPTRMTLAGCSTISVTGRSPDASAASLSIATPSGPTTTTLPSDSGPGSVCSFIPLVCRWRCRSASPGGGVLYAEKDLSDLAAGLRRPVCLVSLGQRPDGADRRLAGPGGRHVDDHFTGGLGIGHLGESENFRPARGRLS